MDERPQAQVEQIYYAHPQDKFWTQDDDGILMERNRELLQKRLRIDLYLSAKVEGKLLSEVDEEVDRAIRQPSVDAALSVAGEMTGVRTVRGVQVLITKSSTPLRTQKGGGRTKLHGCLQQVFGGTVHADQFLRMAQVRAWRLDQHRILTRQTGRNVVTGVGGRGRNDLRRPARRVLWHRRAQPAQYAKSGEASTGP